MRGESCSRQTRAEGRGGEDAPGPLVNEQMHSLQARLYEELDRLRFARTADQKHTLGLEAALAERRKEVADAIAAANAKDAEIAARDEVLAEKEVVIREALASISGKDELVRRFEEIAESRKEELVTLQKQVGEHQASQARLQSEHQSLLQELERRRTQEEYLKARIERIERSLAYRIYIRLKKVASLLCLSRRGE